MRDNFNVEKITKNCIEWIREWFSKNGPTSPAIIGISGGKDSSVVAALCVEALGKDRVIGILMPNGIQHDYSDATEVCKSLGIKYHTLNICQIYNDAISLIENENIFTSNQCVINLPCRLRMTMLYAFAQCVSGRVANTCNLSENYIGYSTRWGDSVGDFAPLAHLLTDEIVAIGNYIGTLPKELVEKIPSDGLCGKTDEDNFGFSYADLNEYILTGNCAGGPEICSKIEALHLRNLFKLEEIPSYFPL